MATDLGGPRSPSPSSEPDRSEPETPAAGLGSSGPETFTSQSDLSSYIKRFLPSLAVMVALGWLIATLLLNAVGVPLPALVALLPAGALGWWAYRFQVKRHEEVHAKGTLTFSDHGVELVDANTRITIAWPDATRIGPGDMMGPLAVGLSDNAAVEAVGAATRASMGRIQETLWGVGRLQIDPGASALVRTTMHQHLDGRDPSRTDVGAPLSVFDPEWHTGRIGEWIATRRPDLLA